MNRGPYRLRDVARATGLPLRRVRSWVDAGVVDVLQPLPHMERLVSREELQRLGRDVGLRVDWEWLSRDTE